MLRTGNTEEDQGIHFLLPGSYIGMNVNWKKKCHWSVMNYNLKGSRNLKGPQINGVVWDKASGSNLKEWNNVCMNEHNMVFNRLSVRVVICNLCYRCSQTNPPVVSQMAADSSKLLLWELHTCCKKCLINRLEFNVEMAVLPCEFTWSPDGILFTVDTTGSVFTVSTHIRVS